MTKEKGIALFLVLGIIMLVILAANSILHIILSQTRLTHHFTSRIQAYYAAKGAMFYAFEKLRLKHWHPGQEYSICRVGCTVQDNDLPVSIRYINVTIGEPGTGLRGTSQVSINVNYTYP